jgi:hypothetical protein
MTSDVIAAAQQLADVLTRENEALKRTDYAAAVALTSDKETALAALSQQAAPSAIPNGLAARIRNLARENQDLLALAITVQTRVVQIVARAHTPPKAEGSYGSHAGRPLPRRAAAMALSTRA